MELHLIRHPRPDVAAGVCYGQADVGLAEAADAVAARLRPVLPGRFALHASPLARARLLAAELGTPALDDRLKEMHFGEWELRPYAEIGAAIDAWAEDPLGFRAPGGESAHEMAARALDWLDGLLAAAPREPVVVVAHGGPLRAIAGHLLGLPAERWLALDFACGHVTRIDVEDWGVVLKWFNR
ncbi:phosphoglycerate mutase [Aromatoleum toluvorans]|uniref:Phosphoglycerate mutase n=1 Tax=Aromatoleum toluvorans TaxID=92002 RepID=A0ABX1PXJ7_9RHOO|nr:alpha-ribazole phosphatase family protein [Aromatoleum toluvorans]NMG43335.1 phosphoglycerate mutase [Aromatoleum toluvorans]